MGGGEVRVQVREGGRGRRCKGEAEGEGARVCEREGACERVQGHARGREGEGEGARACEREGGHVRGKEREGGHAQVVEREGWSAWVGGEEVRARGRERV